MHCAGLPSCVCRRVHVVEGTSKKELSARMADVSFVYIEAKIDG